eukprot:TRINITY_DN50401_c0_g1_i4.p1 TRINITY_DN50401_c0_g1~~TRINITY_DN50401_c0_g1_i4.p1  ORF type:complete len:370 (+),score=85.35 TRINITY_DN50401_c0_g1_i4:83-1192(+)
MLRSLVGSEMCIRDSNNDGDDHPEDFEPAETALGKVMNSAIRAALGRDNPPGIALSPLKHTIQREGDPYRPARGAHTRHPELFGPTWRWIQNAPLTPWLRRNQHEYDTVDSVRAYGCEKYEKAVQLEFSLMVTPSVPDPELFGSTFAAAVGVRKQDAQVVSVEQNEEEGSCCVTVRTMSWKPQRTVAAVRCLNAEVMAQAGITSVLLSHDTMPSTRTGTGSNSNDGPNFGFVPAKNENCPRHSDAARGRDDYDSTLRAECTATGEASLFECAAFARSLAKKLKCPTNTCKVSVLYVSAGDLATNHTTLEPQNVNQQPTSQPSRSASSSPDKLVLAVRIAGALCTAGRLGKRLAEAGRVGGYDISGVQVF